MKKIILFTIIAFVQYSFSQEIEKMDKKELRVAYQNLVISKNNQRDSLINVINGLSISNAKLLDDIKKIQQSVIIEESKNTEKANKINDQLLARCEVLSNDNRKMYVKTKQMEKKIREMKNNGRK